MIINDIEVRERDGLFSLTDIWKAAGSPNGKRPAQFLETHKSLISFIAVHGCNEENQQVTKVWRKDEGTFANEIICLRYAGYINVAFEFEVWRFFLEYHSFKEELAKAITVKATILDRMCSKEGLYTITDSAAEVSKILGVVVSSHDLNAYLREGGFHKHWYNKTRPSCWRDEVVKKGYAGHTTRKDNYGNKRKQLRLTTRGQCRLACQLEKEFVWIMFLAGWFEYQASK